MSKVAARSLLGVCLKEEQLQWAQSTMAGKAVYNVPMEALLQYYEREGLADSNGAEMYANLRHFVEFAHPDDPDWEEALAVTRMAKRTCTFKATQTCHIK